MLHRLVWLYRFERYTKEIKAIQADIKPSLMQIHGVSDNNLREMVTHFNNNFEHSLDYQDGTTEDTRKLDRRSMRKAVTLLRGFRDGLRMAYYQDLNLKRDKFVQWLQRNGGATNVVGHTHSYTGRNLLTHIPQFESRVAF